MSGWVARRCLAAGRVQGVFSRASTQARAESLGVTGHARTLPDGRVEVLACGEPEAVQALCDWLWEGPPAADVVAVEFETLPSGTVPERPAGFRTG